MMTPEIKELIKRMLKNKLIAVQEVAMLQANKKEDRERLIELVQRLYDNGRVEACDGVTAILVEEEDVLMLLEYINSEPITLSPIQYPDNGIKIVPAPYIPNTNPWVVPNTPGIDPLPYRPDIVYCTNQNKMYTA